MASSNNSMCEKLIKLGYVEEETDLRLLKSHFFASKIGGKPSWLSLDPLPQPEELQCRKCSGPCVLLMQVYAPLQMRDDTFHRTLFLFVCNNPSCSTPNDNSSFVVLRSQLPLINDFYSKNPPSEVLECDEDMNRYPNAGHFHSLCCVCGVKGTKKCSRCKKVYYCSKAHQVADWKSGHKKKCQEGVEDSNVKQDQGSSHGVLFKEFDLVTEDEDFVEEDEGDSNNSKSEEERLKEYENLMRSSQLQGLDGKYKTEDLENTATAETEDDKQFLKFKCRIDLEPTQVLRYNRGGEPLWVSAYHKPTPEDILNCSCGASRVFEFQVMPQLLNHLSVDQLDASLDWGTLAVYTCKESCDIGNSYKEEFVWKQDFHNSRELE